MLLANLQFHQQPRRQKPNWQGCESIEGWGFIDRVLEVDQTRSADPALLPRDLTSASGHDPPPVRRHAQARARASAEPLQLHTGEGRCRVAKGRA